MIFRIKAQYYTLKQALFPMILAYLSSDWRKTGEHYCAMKHHADIIMFFSGHGMRMKPF